MELTLFSEKKRMETQIHEYACFLLYRKGGFVPTGHKILIAMVIVLSKWTDL